MSVLTSLVLLAFVLAIGLIILGHGLCRASAMKYPAPPVRAPRNATPAPDTPPRVQGCAPAVTFTDPAGPELCAVITCTQPWTVPIHDGWKVCARHDHRAPYDRTVDPELVSDEAEQWLRGIAS